MSNNDRSQISGPNVSYAPSEGVLVNFTLPAPDAGARMNGELHLEWTVPPQTDPCASLRQRLTTLLSQLNTLLAGIPSIKAGIEGVVLAAERRVDAWHQAHDQELGQLERELASCQSSAGANSAAVIASGTEKGDAEENLHRLYENMNPDQRKALETRFKRIGFVYDQLTPPNPQPAKVLQHLPTPPAPQNIPAVTAVDDAAKRQKDREVRDALCQAFNGKVPDAPTACTVP
jgi:hypothetical protein